MQSDEANQKLNISIFHAGRPSASRKLSWLTMKNWILLFVNALIPSLLFVPCAGMMRYMP